MPYSMIADQDFIMSGRRFREEYLRCEYGSRASEHGAEAMQQR